ncbi:glycosyltransferase family 4 protein, partial [Patescibacteria group bacterium]|nr:glycosyltransferase family 4 protein [Patescibacteria group bacterium]
MKLLFFTRKIDKQDPRVGFVSDWVDELAKNLDFLYILVWQKSLAENLPENVKLIELPENIFLKLIVLKFKLLKYIFKVDGVFTHMMPIYAILVGCCTKIFRKKLVHWYTHSAVNWQLKFSRLFVDEYVTASRESFRIQTKKPVHIFGHGINIEKFKIQNSKVKNASLDSKFIILSVGRISPSKNIDILIKIAEQIQLNEPGLRDKILFQIIGGPGLISQQSYYLDLIKEVKEKNLNNIVDFIGALPQDEIIKYYQTCDLFINLSDTGSLDKVVLEAMASNKIVLTSNIAFKKIIDEQLFCSSKNIDYLIDKIKKIYFLDEDIKDKLQEKLRREVEENHNLENLIK